MRILVTGADGQLGNEMQVLAKRESTTYVLFHRCAGTGHL